MKSIDKLIGIIILFLFSNIGFSQTLLVPIGQAHEVQETYTMEYRNKSGILTVNDLNDGNNIVLNLPVYNAGDSLATQFDRWDYGDNVTINIKSLSDSLFIHSDDLVNGVDSFLILGSQTRNFKFTLTATGWNSNVRVLKASSLLDVARIAAPTGSIIEVDFPSRYDIPSAKFMTFDADLVGFNEGSYGEILLPSGNYARLLPSGGKLWIDHMGAKAEDSNEDNTAFQNAVNYANTWNEIPTYFKAGVGRYYFDKGVVIGIVDQFDISVVEGNMPGYGQLNGTIFELRNDSSFTIAFEGARLPVVRYISFRSDFDFNPDWDAVRNNTWSWASYPRDNITSPHCAIVIDPFANSGSTPVDERYPDFTSWYSGGQSNTSMVVIEYCDFSTFMVSVSVNPSTKTFNCDNIRIEHCAFRQNKTAISSRGGQARQSSISNIYLLGVETFYDDNAVGASPSITHVNGAGDIINFLDVKFDNGPLRVSDVYLEKLTSLGKVDCEYASFERCQFKLFAGVDVYAETLLEGNFINFSNTSLSYYTGCNVLGPFIFDANSIKFENCQFEGQYPYNRQRNGNIEIEDCNWKCKDSDGLKYLSDRGDEMNYSSTGTVSIREAVNQLGEWQNLPAIGKMTYWIEQNNMLINIREIYPNVTLIKDPLDVTVEDTIYFATGTSKEGEGNKYFINDEGVNYRIGDVLRGEGPTNFYFLGMVESFVGDTVFLDHAQRGIPNNYETNMYLIRPKKFIQPFWGDYAIGEDSITNIYGTVPNVGTTVDFGGTYFENYSYVIEVGADWVRVSSDAKSSGTKQLFVDAAYDQILTGSTRNGNPIKAGAVWRKYGNGGLVEIRCTTGGIYGDGTNPPVWGDTLYYNIDSTYADGALLSAGAGIGTISDQLALTGQVAFTNLVGFQDSVGFNNSTDPNAVVTFDVPVRVNTQNDITDKSDNEFIVPFGRDKAQETNVDLDIAALMSRNHSSFEYSSKLTSAASSNNEIDLSTGGSIIRHKMDFWITAVDSSDTYSIIVKVNGDSLIVGDTITNQFIMNNKETAHFKAVSKMGKYYYKLVGLSGSSIHAGIRVDDGGAASITTTPEKINGDTPGTQTITKDDSLITITAGRFAYTGDRTRWFEVHANISSSTATLSDMYYIFAKNSNIISNSERRRVHGNSDIGVVGLIFSVRMAKGDYVEVWTKSESATETLTLDSMNFEIHNIN